MTARLPFGALAGFVAIVAYLSFTVTSYLLYPGPYGPLTNWLSDLGNANVNLEGAVLYRIGSVVAGIALIPFIVSFYRWYGGRRILRNLILAAQFFGGLGAVALVLTGVFSIDNFAPHSFWSSVVFVAFDFFFVFSGIALLYRPIRNMRLASFAIGTAFVDFAFGVFFNTPFGEWITIALLLVYVGLISYYFVRQAYPAPRYFAKPVASNIKK